MPSIPDIPGKSLISGTTKRARMIVVGVAGGALAIGGLVVKRLLGAGEENGEADLSDKVSPIPDAGAARSATKPKRAPKPKSAKPAPPKIDRPPKPKADKPAPKPKAADEGQADKPKTGKSAPKPKAAKASKPKAKAEPRPPAQTGTDAPPKPEVEPGDISKDREHPHRALNNPVGDPNQTEYPDPFEAREDPRDPPDPDEAPFGEEPHVPTNAESTSEPPLEQDPEVPEGGRPPRRDKLDD